MVEGSVEYEVLRAGDGKYGETKWEMFRDIVKECINDICGVKRVYGQRRKESERWGEEIGVLAEKRRAFEKWL